MTKPLDFPELLKRPKLWARYWLMASYQYYIIYTAKQLMTDQQFDLLSRRMRASDEWKEGLHATFITPGMLEAGTGHNLKEEDYPLRTRMAARVEFKQ